MELPHEVPLWARLLVTLGFSHGVWSWASIAFTSLKSDWILIVPSIIHPINNYSSNRDFLDLPSGDPMIVIVRQNLQLTS
jgi:hypothetical protein